jgi:general secretion pathway protein K
VTTQRDQRGFALIMVLWAVALLALLGARVTQAGRGETQLAGNLRDAAIAEAAADGAVHVAVFHLLDRGGAAWRADGQVRLLSERAPRLAVRLSTPRGLVNPNQAPPVLVAALIRAVGGDDVTADAIAAAIFDWHTPGQIVSPGGAKRAQYEASGRSFAPSGRAFTDLDGLGLVLGMTPSLLAALRPHLSLVNFGRIDPGLADPAVAQALASAAVGQPGEDGMAEVVLVRAEAMLENGARFVRRVAVQLNPADASRPARFLTWQAGDD